MTRHWPRTCPGNRTQLRFALLLLLYIYVMAIVAQWQSVGLWIQRLQVRILSFAWYPLLLYTAAFWQHSGRILARAQQQNSGARSLWRSRNAPERDSGGAPESAAAFWQQQNSGALARQNRRGGRFLTIKNILKCKVAKRPVLCRSIVDRQCAKPWSDYAHISSQ